MNHEKAVQYRINRLREQIEEDLSVRAESVDLVTVEEFNSNAPEYLKRKSKQRGKKDRYYIEGFSCRFCTALDKVSRKESKVSGQIQSGNQFYVLYSDLKTK